MSCYKKISYLLIADKIIEHTTKSFPWPAEVPGNFKEVCLQRNAILVSGLPPRQNI